MLKYKRGNREYIVFCVCPDEMNPKLLPAALSLTIQEEIVLVFTRSCKSSHGGIKNYRFYEACHTGITLQQWEASKQSCIDKKLLDRRGALTVAGRNAAGTKDPYTYKGVLNDDFIKTTTDH